MWRSTSEAIVERCAIEGIVGRHNRVLGFTRSKGGRDAGGEARRGEWCFRRGILVHLWFCIERGGEGQCGLRVGSTRIYDEMGTIAR